MILLRLGEIGCRRPNDANGIPSRRLNKTCYPHIFFGKRCTEKLLRDFFTHSRSTAPQLFCAAA
jgi:hypothetical protein